MQQRHNHRTTLHSGVFCNDYPQYIEQHLRICGRAIMKVEQIQRAMSVGVIGGLGAIGSADLYAKMTKVAAKAGPSERIKVQFGQQAFDDIDWPALKMPRPMHASSTSSTCCVSLSSVRAMPSCCPASSVTLS